VKKPIHHNLRGTQVRKLALTLAGVATVALALTQSMAASPSKEAHGTEVTTFAMTTESRTADGNLIEERIATRVFSGTFSGKVASQFTRITFKDGDRFSHGFETCTCTVEGRTGTVTFRFMAWTNDKTVGTEAHLTIVDATAGLEGLHGVLEIAAGVYTGSYHFESD
jgi:Protein of unknown function (DUF3224)